MGTQCIVPISTCDIVKIYVFSVLCAIWVIVKRILRKVWRRSAKHGQPEKRGSPPFCLLDTALGQHSYVKLKEVKFHYVESGNKDKPLLLLLHGFPDCWISWRRQMAALSPHFRIVAVDLKGFGDSDKPLSARSYRLSNLVLEIRELITALGVRSCSVVGHDLGALLGWYLVHCFSDCVTKFVAISCPHPNVYWDCLPASSTFNSRPYDLHSQSKVGEMICEHSEPMDCTLGTNTGAADHLPLTSQWPLTAIEKWIHVCQLPCLAETEALNNDLKIIDDCYQHVKNCKGQEIYLDAYKYTFSRREDWSGAVNYYRNLPFWRIAEGSEPTPVPTMLMTGNKDQWVDMESIIKSTDFVEKLSVKVVDGAGHFPHQEHPETVNKLLLSFLVVKSPITSPDKRQQGMGLVNRVFNSTKWYGSQMLDVVQKTTNFPIPTKSFTLGQGSG